MPDNLSVAVSDCQLVDVKGIKNRAIRHSISLVFNGQTLVTGVGALYTYQRQVKEQISRYGRPYSFHDDVLRAAKRIIEEQKPDLVAKLPPPDNLNSPYLVADPDVLTGSLDTLKVSKNDTLSVQNDGEVK